jgi:Tfp pilus assembly protein PilZ
MKKKSLLLVILTFVLSIQTFAQAPNWQWAHSEGGSNFEAGRGITIDNGGNILVVGRFTSFAMTFDTIVLTNSGMDDMFVVKYDGSGNVLWAKRAGGTSSDAGMGVAIDSSGNILVTGIFSSPTITFGTTVLTNSSSGTYDIFIVKYDALGNVLWASSAGGTTNDRGNNISTDVGGNILVTGQFESPSITFGTIILTNAGSYDMFTAKYDAAGNILWANSAGGSASDVAYDIGTDSGGNVFATGGFGSTSLTFGTTVLTNSGANDMFVVKYDTAGHLLWANSAGAIGDEEGIGIATDASANVLVTGYFTSSSIAFGTTVLTNAGNPDILLVKYDAAGNVLWANSAGGTSSDFGFCVATDTAGNVLLTGRFMSPSIAFGTTVLATLGFEDIFVAKYNGTGNVLWAISAGGTQLDESNGIAIAVGGNILVTGDFGSPSITFGTTILTNSGNYDMFVANIDDSPPTGLSDEEILGSVFSPNPFTTQATITFSNSLNNATFFIYNLLGEKVASATGISGESFQFNRGNLPSGVYVFEVTQKDKRIARGKAVVY